MSDEFAFKCPGCCNERKLHVPHLGAPVQCACGLIYTVTVSPEAMYRESRRLRSSVDHVDNLIASLTSKLTGR